jgi:hypothetical protein
MWFPARGEKGVVGRFEYYDQLDVARSKAADDYRYKKIVVLRTKVAGDQDENFLPVKPHNQDSYINRFPDAWQAFQGEETPVDGTPLTELGLTESKISAFRINAIYTVEQVADLSDAMCEKVGFGTRKLRADAQTLLAERRQAGLNQAVAMAAQQPQAAPEAVQPPGPIMVAETEQPKRKGWPKGLKRGPRKAKAGAAPATEGAS